MNENQQLVGWLAVFAILIAVWFIYRTQLSAILFTTSIGHSTSPPAPNDPSGAQPIQPTPAPAGQSGSFGVDPNGDLYKWLNGQWVPYGTTAPGNQPFPTAFVPPLGLVGTVV